MTGTRDLIHNALAETRGLVGGVVQDLRQQNTLTDDEVLAQYEQIRGNPLAVVEFTRSRTGLQGTDAVQAALKYEDEMEQLRARQAGANRW